MTHLVPFTVEGKDIYNPTAPFENNGEMIIAARVESRDSETDSETRFFRKNRAGEWRMEENGSKFAMQDPFVTKIDGKLILGGVKVDWTSGIYTTEFYIGQNINNLKYLTCGPAGMKDIRLVKLKDDRLGVFTRPQGEVGGLGKIGFTTIDKLAELNASVIKQARLIEDQFGEKRWGGVNQAILLANGNIGILGHVAEFEVDGCKRYSVMVFEFNP
ncbi:MAG: DUF1861 family protein, partial [Candidatus Amesbacteria bacterium]|nr:DUF1861 family protein [Candidatus Amesbacteria bacterium]